VLGILHLRTPLPPASIGSSRKGLKLLQHATELFPDYPENYLYLAEALRDNGKMDEAKTALRKVLVFKFDLPLQHLKWNPCSRFY
jgi:tetratricopeptide (TPR) repeat protein